jgi:class 3 adenylate cyclase
MKLQTYLILIILMSPLISASIESSSTLQEKYNLGEKIKASFDLTGEEDTQATAKVSLICGEYTIDYSTTLIDIEKDRRITINAPSLKPSVQMIGTCYINVLVESFDKNVIDQFKSNEFSITNELELNLELEQTEYLPGDKVNININNAESYDNLNATFSFDDEASIFEFDQNSIEIELSEKIKSGSHEIFVVINDEFKNIEEATLTININPVPILLETELEKPDFNPQEKFNSKIKLIDQADNEIEGEEINIKLINKKGKEIFTTIIKSSEVLSFEFPQFIEPGKYFIISEFEDLKQENEIDINPVENIEIAFDKNLAYVKNIGNVEYDKTVNIKLEEEFHDLILTRNINLKPDETKIIDLSKEVPMGDYTASQINEDNESISTPTPLSLEDNRNLIKKLLQEGTSITGYTISPAVKGSLIGIPLLLIVVIILSIFLSHKGIKKEVREVIAPTIKAEKKKSNILNSMLKKSKKEKNKAHNILKQFVDPNIANTLIEKKETKIQGEKKDISVLFTDIRGFTSITEKSEPWASVNMLNMYLEHMTEHVTKNNGTLNKFIGDSIMALYNAPTDNEDHIFDAIKTALGMKQELKKLNKTLKEKGLKEIKMGIGINSGKAIIGNIGTNKRMEYTAIGNTVNVAERLEENATADQILISKQTYNKIKDRINVKKIGEIELKNIEHPILVYDVIGLK